LVFTVARLFEMGVRYRLIALRNSAARRGRRSSGQDPGLRCAPSGLRSKPGV